MDEKKTRDELLKEQREILQSLNQINLEVENATATLAALNDQKNTVEASVEAIKTDLDGLSVARAGKLTQLTQLSEDIRIATSSLDTLKKQADEAVIDNAKAVQDTQETQDGLVRKASEAVAVLASDKERLEKELAPLNEEAARTNALITAANVTLSGLAKKIEDAEVALLTLTGKQSTVNASVNELQTRADTLATQIDEARKTLAALEAEIASKREEGAGLAKDNAAVKKELETNNERNSDFLKERAGLMDARVELDQRMSYLKSKYGELGEPWG